MASAGELQQNPRTTTPSYLRCVSVLGPVFLAVILACAGASSAAPYPGSPRVSPPVSHSKSGSHLKTDSQEGQAAAAAAAATTAATAGAGSPSTVVIDADEIIDEMAAASPRHSSGGGSTTEEGGEGVYESTQVYRQSLSSTSSSQQLIARGRRSKRRRCVVCGVGAWINMGWVASRAAKAQRKQKISPG